MHFSNIFFLLNHPLKACQWPSVLTILKVCDRNLLQILSKYFKESNSFRNKNTKYVFKKRDIS